MPRDPMRRRSLPSAIERTLSLNELIGDEDKHNARRVKVQEQQKSALQSMNAYFAMIDQTELVVESVPVSACANSAKEPDAASDSELLHPNKLERRQRTRATRKQGARSSNEPYKRAERSTSLKSREDKQRSKDHTDNPLVEAK